MKKGQETDYAYVSSAPPHAHKRTIIARPVLYYFKDMEIDYFRDDAPRLFHWIESMVDTVYTPPSPVLT